MKKEERKKKEKKDSGIRQTKETKSKRDAGKAIRKEEKEDVNIVREIIEMVLYAVFLFAVTWAIITFVGVRTRVRGPSMYDTLHDGDNLWVSKISYRIHEPERFDIVTFPEEDEFYIKRIIGMPGEKIRIDEEGSIYINGELLEEDYGYEVIDEDMIGRAAKEITLGADEYFVMGDNRNNSLDSRDEDVGNIKRDELVGKAVFRIWPLSRFGKLEKD